MVWHVQKGIKNNCQICNRLLQSRWLKCLADSMARELTTTYSCQKSVQIVSGFTQAVRLAGLALGGFVFAVLVLAVFGATVFGRTETVFGRCCMVGCVCVVAVIFAHNYLQK